jgi:quinol monooxygenase YgiN
MYGLSGKLKAHPGQRDALMEVLMRGVKALHELEGCYLYVISTLPDDPDSIWINEVWRSQEDHRASLAHEGVRAVITEGRPLIAEMSEGLEMVPVGGKGLPG